MAITRVINPATADNNLTYPDKSGTVALLSDIPSSGGGLLHWTEGLIPTNNGTYLKATEATQGVVFSAGVGNTAPGALAIVLNGGGNTASGLSAVVGGDTNTGAGLQSGVLSGTGNITTILAEKSVVGGGTLNTTSSPNTTVAGGKNCTAGASHTTNGQFATVGGGDTCTASGTGSTVPGGKSNTASANYSTAIGAYALSYAVGMVAHGGGTFSGIGNAQDSKVLLRRATTEATPSTLSTNGSAALSTNALVLQANSAVTWEVRIICKQSGSGNHAGWRFSGTASKGTTAGSLIVNTDVTNVLTNTGLTGANAVISADTTNGAFMITVTGLAATSLRWVAAVTMTEVVFP